MRYKVELEFMTAVFIQTVMDSPDGDMWCDIHGDLPQTIRRIEDHLGPWEENTPIGAHFALNALGYYRP